MSGILLLQTGGTIDTDYPKQKMGYAFEICGPAADRILSKGKSTMEVEVQSICRKDSQDTSEADRNRMGPVTCNITKLFK